MNRKQLQKLGVPPDCAATAIRALSKAAEQGTGLGLKGKRARQLVTVVLHNPRQYEADPVWGEFARELLAESAVPAPRSIDYRTWGDDIDTAAHQQMRAACQVPSARSPSRIGTCSEVRVSAERTCAGMSSSPSARCV